VIGGTLRQTARIGLRGLLALALVYGALSGLLAWALGQPPHRVTRILRYLPQPLVFRVLPGPRLWRWARQGPLAVGDPAPDFTLPLLDRSGSVTLSSFRGRKPVVLVFGSYT
jgi:hypothetical protein